MMMVFPDNDGPNSFIRTHKDLLPAAA